MFNIDPYNHFHASIPTDTKYYSDEQFVGDVKSVSDLSFIHFNARSLSKNFQKIKDTIDDLKLSFDIIAIGPVIFCDRGKVAEFAELPT